MTASATSDTSERMPLHASATSRDVLARTMTLPSRRTGIWQADKVTSPNREASICRGNAIWLKMMAGIGNREEQEQECEPDRSEMPEAPKEDDSSRECPQQRQAGQE